MPGEDTKEYDDAALNPGFRSGAKSENKRVLRERFKLLAKEFLVLHDEAARAAMHRKIAQTLSNYAHQHLLETREKPLKIAVYQPMKIELPAREIVSQADFWKSPNFLLPQIDGQNMWFTDDTGAQVTPDVMIVPGLFVDPKGNRLGRGKGYYDRYLAAAQIPLARRIFLGYEFQFIAEVPVTANDMPVTPLPS